jgi:hypothetical protein
MGVDQGLITPKRKAAVAGRAIVVLVVLAAGAMRKAAAE